MMSNWFKHGRTDLCAGFQQQGNVCEGGNCNHLKEGDQAYGYSSENDSFGSEYYLMCQLCFEEFLEKRKKEPVECHDCKAEVPRNTTKIHIPYFVDEEPRAKWAKIICSECQTKGPHLRRLERDEEDRSHDQDGQGDWFDEHEPDEREVDLDPALTRELNSLMPRFNPEDYPNKLVLRKRLLDTLFSPEAKHAFYNAPKPVIDPDWVLPDKPFLNRLKGKKTPGSIFTDCNIITGSNPTLKFPMHANIPSFIVTFWTEDKNPGIKHIVVKRKIK